ncbi:MAG: chemotaxis protein CheW [Cyanobacteria bacterium J06621_11]
MLMLLFRIKDEPWALSIDDVKDLIPLVTLQPCVHLGENVVGLLNYHGEHLPVIDVSSVLARQRSPDAFSTRIAIVEIEVEIELDADADLVSEETDVVRLGLILDQAYETADLTKAVDIPLQKFADGPFIQSMLESAEGSVVQQLALSPLLSQVMHSYGAGS